MYNIIYSDASFSMIHVIFIERKCCRNENEFYVEEAILEDFDEIIMSTSMATDHLPDKYFTEIQQVLQRRLKKLTV